jgi:hypothetical protein
MKKRPALLATLGTIAVASWVVWPAIAIISLAVLGLVLLWLGLYSMLE